MRKLVAGTGWKMNIGAAEATRYGRELALRLPQIDVSAVDIFVLPPFTSLSAASAALAEVAEQGWLVSGGHLGGFFRVEREGDSFRFVPQPV